MRQLFLLIIGLLAIAAIVSLGIAGRWEVWLLILIPGSCVWLLLNPEDSTS